MTKSIGILGSGAVGITLANGLREIGYEVRIGNRKGSKVDEWDGQTAPYAEIAAESEVLVLSLKGTAAESVIESIKDNITGKIVIDTTNPIANETPEDGVLNYFTNINESLMERLQDIAPEAHFVKAFNSVGSTFMVNPQFKDGRPTMFICGNDGNAKAEVGKLLGQLGWDSEDMGGVKSARAIEPLCMLWCIPGLRNNEWSHAFKLLKST
jgi:predicted dinucleotide-binding enzyme